MSILLRKLAISFLLRKAGRRDITTTGEDALQNDDVYLEIFGFDDNHKHDFCVARSIEDNSIRCVYFDDHEEKYTLIPISALNSFRMRVSYYYRGWEFYYDNLYEPCFHILFRVPYFRKLFQRRYDKSVRTFSDRIRVLQTILDLGKLNDDSHVTFDSILTRIYGPKIHLSQMKFKCYEHLRQILLSFKGSGEINIPEGFVIDKIEILPKAFQTIDEYQREQRKYDKSLSISKKQLYVAIIMAILALIALCVSN